jgi:hypothetical protein
MQHFSILVCIYDLDDIIIESCLALLFEVASLESQRLPSSFLMKFSGASLGALEQILKKS